MKTTERFDRAYNALVSAYYNETLIAGHCAACAIGNIVADCMNYKIPNLEDLKSVDKEILPNLNWVNAIRRLGGFYNILDMPESLDKEQLLKLTGYSDLELERIEKVFEKNTIFKWFYKDYQKPTEKELLEDQFNGLCAVVDVLLELDNINSEDHYKQKFREHPKLIKA